MDASSVLAELEKRGKESARKTYARHGVRGACFGVSYADLNALSKAIRVDHKLALALWETGVHDARILATRIVDPVQLDPDTALQWIGAADNYITTDAVAGVIGRMPAGLALARRLIDSDDEWPSAAGWSALGQLGASGVLDDALALQLLARIRQTLHTAPNRTRYSMNNALINLGGYRATLRHKALEVARVIGPVEVDHGETGCETPDAVAYIAKMVAHANRPGAAKKKAPAKEAPAKKGLAKKAPAKKAPAKKAPAKKAPAKKATAKKATAKKATAKKATAKKATAKKR